MEDDEIASPPVFDAEDDATAASSVEVACILEGGGDEETGVCWGVEIVALVASSVVVISEDIDAAWFTPRIVRPSLVMVIVLATDAPAEVRDFMYPEREFPLDPSPPLPRIV